MYSRKTETHRLLGRLIGQPMFRTLSWFCLYSSKLEYFGGAEGSKKGIQHVEATSSLLFVLEVVREINSTTLLIKASRSVWHNYFPLYITLHVRTYECWVHRFSLGIICLKNWDHWISFQIQVNSNRSFRRMALAFVYYIVFGKQWGSRWNVASDAAFHQGQLCLPKQHAVNFYFTCNCWCFSSHNQR